MQVLSFFVLVLSFLLGIGSATAFAASGICILGLIQRYPALPQNSVLVEHKEAHTP